METLDTQRQVCGKTYLRMEEYGNNWGVNMSYNYSEVPTDFEAMAHRIDEARRRGETRSQLDQAGIVQEAWLPRQRRQVLHQVGRFLVTMGERLEQDVLATPSV
jgi:hypothetical protein